MWVFLWKSGLACCSSLLSVVMNSLTKSSLGSKEFISDDRLQSIISGSQGENEDINLSIIQLRKATSWLTSWLMLCYFLNTAQSHLPRNSTACSGLGPSSSIRNLENPHRHAPGLIWWKQLPVPRCVKLPITITYITCKKTGPRQSCRVWAPGRKMGQLRAAEGCCTTGSRWKVKSLVNLGGSSLCRGPNFRL